MKLSTYISLIAKGDPKKKIKGEAGKVQTSVGNIRETIKVANQLSGGLLYKMIRSLPVILLMFLFSSCGTFKQAQGPAQVDYKTELAIRKDSIRSSRKMLVEQRKAELARNGFIESLDTAIAVTPIGGICHANITINESDAKNYAQIVYVDITGIDTVCHPPQWFIDHYYPVGYHRFLQVRTCCINMGPEDYVVDTNYLHDRTVSSVCVDGQYMKNYYKFYTEDCLENIESYGWKELLWLVSDNGLYNIVHLDFWGDTIVENQQELDRMLQLGPYPDLSIVFNPYGNGGTIQPPFYEEPFRMVIDRGAGDCYYNLIPFEATSGYHNIDLKLNIPETVIDVMYPNEIELPFLVTGDDLDFNVTMPNCCPYATAPDPVTGLDVSNNNHTLHWNASVNSTGYNVYMALAYQDHGWHADSAMILLTPQPITTTFYQYAHTGVFYYYFVQSVNCAGHFDPAMLNKKLK